MHFLILGGTSFLGARTVETALERGHRVTLFNRGRTRADRFRDDERVTHLIGDRDPEVGAGLSALEGTGDFDAVLDLSGYVPRHVRASSKMLSPRTDTYLFISSVSVYDAPIPIGVDEDGPLIRLDDQAVEEITPATYGGMKVIGEEDVRAAAGDKALIIRPGIIAGPDDFTDRFSYWTWAAAENAGRSLLCPGSPRDETQIIDAGDLGRWLVELCERGARQVRDQEGTDVFNASGPEGSTTIAELIGACIEAAPGADAQPVWIPIDFLSQHGVTAFADMPLWIPAGTGREGLLTADSARAYRAGLKSQSLVETARQTLAWLREDFEKREVAKPKVGLDLERAREVMSAWLAATPT